MATQGETVLQKQIVEFINKTKILGAKVFRIKNGGTYDPTAGVFRKASTEPGIPDIIGVAANGRGIFIEVKMPDKFGRGRPSKISQDQKDFLMEMFNRGAIVGVAWDMSDAFDIIACDEEKYPRKERTWYFNVNRESSYGKKGTKVSDPVARIIASDTPKAQEKIPDCKPKITTEF